MLRRYLPPLDSYLGDATTMDESAFLSRYRWPVLVTPEPTQDLLSKLKRPETVVDEIGDDTLLDVMNPGMAGASLDALCLVLRPLDAQRQRIRIGRSPNSDVVLIDHSISRAHADLLWDPASERAVLIDLDTKNGTSVDQRTLEPRKETILVSGSLVTFGSLVTRYYSPKGFRTWLVAGAPRSGASPAKWPGSE